MDDHHINAVLRAIEDKPDIVLVGGNAIVVWVRHYASAPEFAVGDVVTTRDIDFLGTPTRARQLAAAVDASIKVAGMDDLGPSTAVLDLGSKNEDDERIDFINHVQGPGGDVERAAVSLQIRLPGDPAGTLTTVRIMHPLHCLQSKLANRLAIGRVGASAQAQLEATSVVLREYISEMLDQATKPSIKLAMRTMERLGDYLQRDFNGRHADQQMARDPLVVLEQFAADERLPELYRQHQVAGAIERVREMRSRRSPGTTEGSNSEILLRATGDGPGH